MRKFFALFISSFIAIGCTFAFSGCTIGNTNKEPFQSGYYMCRSFNDEYIDIISLSEEGQKQKFLVLPLDIDGIPVVHISDRAMWGCRETQWESDALEKIYALKKYEVIYEDVFDGCTNLDKVISLYRNSGLPIPSTSAKVYHPRYFYENRSNNTEWQAPANVSFLWNYEDAENEGYYWIDDLDYGEKITLIPDEPIRKGYRFTGWYKDPECIDLWDFSSDTTPAEQFDEDGNLVYQETCLYAGWMIVGG